VIGPSEYLDAARSPMEKMGGPTYGNACSDFDAYVPPVSQ